METFSARNTSGDGPPPARLDSLSDGDLLTMVRSRPPSDERRADACGVLVERYGNLVRSCVHRYTRSPEPVEDLMHVGYVGLLKAINNFDPDAGGSLTAYAQPCISGEVKRHFRDKRWQVRVERPLQERVLEVRSAAPELAQRLGRAPADAELASHLQCDVSEVREAQMAGRAFSASSLDAPVGSGDDEGTLADHLGADDSQIEHALDMEALAAHWDEVPRREQRILLMRFYGDMTQAQIGARMGISQMHVSRLLTHALGLLRERLAAATRAAIAPDDAA
jgi:RNA polymerase sigma-B factor